MKRIGILTGGGDCPGLNAVIRAAVRTLIRDHQIEVVGIQLGFEGLLTNATVPLTLESIRGILPKGGTLLRTTNRGNPFEYPKQGGGCEDRSAEVIRNIGALGIDGVIAIGGDGTLKIAQRLCDLGIPMVAVPKTIDNDLVGTDHTPGYPSAARFVVQAFMGANLDNRALPGVYVAVVMGRHAGFLTAASALAQKFADDGPHLVYLPERAFSLDRFLGDVRAATERHGRCVVAVSEGVHDGDGTAIAAKLAGEVERDAHGNVALSGSGSLADLLAGAVRSRLGLGRVRGETLGYLQRSFVGCVSDLDRHEAREVGEKAVQYAMWGGEDGSVSIHRTGFYSVEYRLTPLAEVAGRTRAVPDEFIAGTGTGVTDAFRLYLRPLLGSGLPEVHRLRLNPVERLLGRTGGA